MDNFFNNQRIVELIWKRKIHFVVIGFVAILLSAIFSGSFFIPPQYKSLARIYPANIGKMSDESRTEQMLEILNSDDIKFKVFEAFNLDKVYEIPKNSKHFITEMLDVYDSRVSINKTPFETAEISVFDTDPQRAANMCDSLIAFYNLKVGGMHKIKHKEMIDIYAKQIAEKHKELTAYKSKLDSIREVSGIISYEQQTPEATRAYMTALSEGKASDRSAAAKKLESIYQNLSKFGSEELLYAQQFETTLERIAELNITYDEHWAEYKKDISYSYVVENPFPADKKSYPVRWLIVLLSTMSAMFVALLTFLVLDQQKA